MSGNVCFGPPFSLEGILTVQQSQLAIYKKAWSDYSRIQGINSNVSTLRFNNEESDLTYYIFISYAERSSFRTGQFLHQQIYPTSNWNSVEQN